MALICQAIGSCEESDSATGSLTIVSECLRAGGNCDRRQVCHLAQRVKVIPVVEEDRDEVNCFRNFPVRVNFGNWGNGFIFVYSKTGPISHHDRNNCSDGERAKS